MTASTLLFTSTGLLVLPCLFVNSAMAFVPPRAFVPTIRAAAPSASSMSSLHALTPPLSNTEQMLSPLVSSLESSTTSLADGIGETLVTIASVVAIIFFGFGALLLIMANIVIPKAAEELEVKARKEYPEYWAACEAKLEEGETLAMRPDLIQELGRQVQEGDLKKFEAMAEQEESSSDSSSSSSSSDVVDVEVIDETKEDKK